MRVGIDLFSLVPGTGRGGGFHRYARGLLSGLAQLQDDHEYHLFTNRANCGWFPSDNRFVQHVIPLPPRRELWPFRLLWLHVLLPWHARQLKLELVHFPLDTGSAWLSCPSVVTVHDLITDVFYPAHFPGSVSPVKAAYLFRIKRRSARKAAAVICPSQVTADAVICHYGVPADKLAVVPEAADQSFFEARKSAPERKAQPAYALAVASLSPHKNLSTLIEAFRLAREAHRLHHELIIVGMEGTDPRRAAAGFPSPDAEGVRYLGFVDEPRLLELYGSAEVLLFLSLIEGFGLPPLEAMAAGVPVIASDIPVLREVCGNGALYVPARDVRQVADAIARVLRDGDLGARLRRVGYERARQFSWIRTAAATREIYQRVVQGRRRKADG